ncbi:polysaccharide biosynthesis tyrosine autokinase [Salinisphaera orenii]|uniref:polysaccharide biosynthesis tyrosine autokinase n=1 Tax=Salinisphaera orenii TaxID=856731 RepID=UPI000F4974BE|nr:polysaccharide biosynthesis tyrosine autokinase [Salinisphaera halophila]
MTESHQGGTDPSQSNAVGRDDEIEFAQLWNLLWGGRWKIVAFVVVALLCAVFYLFVVQPTYQTDALLKIEDEGSQPLQGVTNDLKQLAGKGTTLAESEIPIIKSRTVLGDTVEGLGLETVSAPAYFPVIGQAVAERRELGPLASSAVPPDAESWFGRYAWQPVHATVERMNVPDDLLGQAFTLRALGGGQYLLFGPEGDRILEGTVGEVAEGETSRGAAVGVFVSDIAVSDPPTDFRLTRRGALAVVEELQNKLRVAEEGDESGIVRVTLEGKDKARITDIVNAVANNYLRQNVEARSAEAEKSLEFLNEQMPELKADLEAAEARLTQYQQNNDTIDLGKEGQALLNQMVAIEDKRSQLELRVAELRQTYTGQHPALEAAREQMQQLAQEKRQLEERIGGLPGAQKEMFGLRRDVEVNTQLYTALLNRAQQLRVIKAGTVGNVRIVDHAVQPMGSIGPKTVLVLTLAIVLGGLLGVAFVFVQAAVRRGVDDPKAIENRLGLSVYAVVPFSNWLEQQSARARRRRQPLPLLARDNPEEVAVEALRSMRTSLYFAQTEADSNVILMTGPTPGVGKSFVSMNLAYLLAEVGQSVVVVDADLRKGRIHEFVKDRQRAPGLSQVLTGHVELDDALRTSEDLEFSVLTTGQLPPNPSEMLMRKTFPQLLERLKKRFDIVLVDAPPVLAVTDAAIIRASLPGVVTFMVAAAGRHPMGELEETAKRLASADHKVAGVVFNAYQKKHENYAGGYSYYRYEYKK